MSDETRAAWAGAWVAAWAEMPDVGQGRTVQTEKYSYTYAALEDILTAVRPVLAQHGLAVSQSVVRIDDDHVGVETRIIHEAGHVEVFGPTPMPMSGGPQQIGSSITYARRYSLAPALGIATEEDDDAAAATPSRSPALSEFVCPSCGSAVADNRAAHHADSKKPAWKCSNKQCQGGGLRDKDDESKGRWGWASWHSDQFDTDQSGDGDRVERMYQSVAAKLPGETDDSIRRDIAEAAVYEAADGLGMIWPDSTLDREQLNEIYTAAVARL